MIQVQKKPASSSLALAGFTPRVQMGPEALLHKIVDACASNVAVLDELGTVLYASSVWRVFGDAQDGFTFDDRRVLSQLRPFNKRGGFGSTRTDSLAEDIEQVLQGKENEFQREYIITTANSTRWFLVHAARLDLADHESFRILVTCEEITRHKQAEEELRLLGGRLIRAQEEERSRVARELHDDLNQQLAILSIELEQLGQKIPKRQVGLSARVRSLSAKAQQISSDVHRISYELHPSKLDHLGLAPAIKSLCEELSTRHELTINFRAEGFPAVLPRDVTLCLYRVTQESLSNMIKHSKAEQADVVLNKTSDQVRLDIADLGCGFDIESAQTKTGLGIISMRERLRLVGGEISIRSQPSLGTKIHVLVPLDDSKLPVQVAYGEAPVVSSFVPATPHNSNNKTDRRNHEGPPDSIS